MVGASKLHPDDRVISPRRKAATTAALPAEAHTSASPIPSVFEAPPVTPTKGADSMRWYLKSIGKQRLLAPEEVSKLSVAVQKLLHWDYLREELSEQLMREPSTAELAADVGLSVDEYSEELARMRSAKGLLVNAN